MGIDAVRAPLGIGALKAPFGIIVGLQAEARLLRSWGLPVGIGGGTAEGAGQAADRLAPHVEALLSFGLAGGLDPALRPGDVLVPALVVDAGDRWPTDPGLNQRLGGSTGQTLLGGGALLATAAEKQAARAGTGAAAVDLESAAVARAAARHGRPFAVLRAVCDDAARTLPRAAVVALDSAGGIGLLRVLGAVLARPGEIPALLALARDAARARRALQARVAKLSRPGGPWC
ncbi:MAG: phosphorylase [Janthinobacterium lividum]